MLDTEVVDLLNSRQLWGFVGSGTSTDSGLPGWKELVTEILYRLDPDAQSRVANNHAFDSAMLAEHYPRALGVIADEVGRPATVTSLITVLGGKYTPGALTQQLARWPFKGYITTNYDSMLEDALAKIGSHDWAALGNNGEDSKLTTRNASQVVWHWHGGVSVAKSSNFILTENDYAGLYDRSAAQLEYLRALLTQQRVLFVGFGFRDHDLMKQLELVGSMCNPANPAFAFVPDSIAASHRNKLFDLYNVKSLVYQNSDGTHKGLISMMRVYGSFIVSRAYSFSNSVRKTPSQDAETTSLFLYNELVMKKHAPLGEDILVSLTKARVLSILRYRPNQNEGEFTAELESRLATVAVDSEFSPYQFQATLAHSLQDLVTDELIVLDTELRYHLTDVGHVQVEGRSADAALLERAFSAALGGRVRNALPDIDAEGAERIQDAAFTFYLECVRARAVGIAKSLFKSSEASNEYQVLSLLSSLPTHMRSLANADEALGLVRVVTDILTNPTDKEKTFLGAAIQAQFALVIMGYSPDLLKAHAKTISETAFIFDSASLISRLAKGSSSHESTASLISQVQKLGATTICTEGLVDEVAEHARWVQNAVGRGTLISEPTLRTMLGSAGSRGNLFLEGAVHELELGATFTSFGDYLNSVFTNSNGSTCRPDIVASALSRLGVPCFSPTTFEGFESHDLADEDAFMNEIESLRKKRETFTHSRQVQTEARIVIFVRLLRSGKYRIAGTKYSDAFFISNSRVLDRLKDADLPITMVPSALQQWLLALSPCEPAELRVLFDSLILELDQQGYSLVNRSTIQTVFSPLIDLSKEKLGEELEKYKTLTANMYGQDASQAFSSISPINAPLALNSFYAQRANVAESALVNERNARELAQRTRSMSERDKEELARLRAEKKQRKLQANARRRSAQSRKGTAKKRK